MAARILVVDDSQKKLDRIISVLREVGVERGDIDVAQTGVDARNRLSETSYDLLILDIALPMRAEEAPDREGGIKLLTELSDRPIFKLPQSVVGLTGFEDLHKEFVDQFRSKLWTLELYDSANAGWVERLKAKARYIIARAEQKPELQFGCDLCVVTALQAPEFQALRSLNWGWGPPASLDEVGYYYEGGFESGGRRRTAFAAAAPRMGMVATAILSTKVILKFRPRLLIMVGICAGVQGNSGMGDVLVADPSWDWQMGKYVDGQFYISPDHIDIPTAVGERFVQLSEDKQLWFEIYNSFQGKKPDNLPTVKVGPVTCGSAVLADKSLLKEIKAQHRKLLGVDMELYGMYAAARDCSQPGPITFGIKSVCDFADQKKNDDFQAYSAHVAARALSVFCERYAADFLPAK